MPQIELAVSITKQKLFGSSEEARSIKSAGVNHVARA